MQRIGEKIKSFGKGKLFKFLCYSISILENIDRLYRKSKAIFYIEFSSFLLYLFLKTRITPNTVTTIHIILGIFAGILISIPLKIAIIAGVIIFFLRPVLDWCDGILAIKKNQVSLTGTILDPYAAFAGWIALWVGLGLYVANKSSSVIFHYLVPVIPAIFAADIITFAQLQLKDNEQLKRNINNATPSKEDNNSFSESFNLGRIILPLNRLFEGNATMVDMLCLIISLEIFCPRIFISKYIYLIFIFWQVALFSGKFYLVASGKWVDKETGKRTE